MKTILGTRPAPVKAQLKAALTMTYAVAEVIREARAIPAGHLYVAVIAMPGAPDISAFDALLRVLKGAGLVREDASHLLTWIGPEVRP